jgi:hypothetical protein
LEALECALSDDKPYIDKSNRAITAIKQALAQPEPEPAIYPDEAFELGLERIAYYTSPPKREQLTDEQIDALPFPPSGTATLRDFVRIIEVAHGIFANAQNKGEA